MIMFTDHLRHNHREFLEQIIDDIIDAVRNEINGEDDDGGGS